jgi:hypothetical protein
MDDKDTAEIYELLRSQATELYETRRVLEKLIQVLSPIDYASLRDEVHQDLPPSQSKSVSTQQYEKTIRLIGDAIRRLKEK